VSDLPPDVRSTLAQLLDEAAVAARTRDAETLTATMESVATVTAEDVPPGDLSEQLRHGCRRVRRVASDEPLVAAAYCEAMQRRVED
jgi:hypothetical protein